MLTYVVGDIHGHLEPVVRMLDWAHRDAKGEDYKRIFLGDYIDRGPQSKEVIAHLISIDRGFPNDVFLKGNHEDMFLNNLQMYLVTQDDEDREWAMRGLAANGGLQTLRSYGLSEFHEELEFPVEHLRWMAQLRLYHEDKYRYYVHAGIDPTIPLVAQKQADLLWIRNRFLIWPEMYEKYIVHGHTPTFSGMPDIRHNRCNMDTGGCFDGVFSIARFDDHQTKPTDVFTVPGYNS